jgi:hypothetical protein
MALVAAPTARPNQSRRPSCWAPTACRINLDARAALDGASLGDDLGGELGLRQGPPRVQGALCGTSRCVKSRARESTTTKLESSSAQLTNWSAQVTKLECSSARSGGTREHMSAHRAVSMKKRSTGGTREYMSLTQGRYRRPVGRGWNGGQDETYCDRIGVW